MLCALSEDNLLLYKIIFQANGETDFLSVTIRSTPVSEYGVEQTRNKLA